MQKAKKSAQDQVQPVARRTRTLEHILVRHHVEIREVWGNTSLLWSIHFPPSMMRRAASGSRKNNEALLTHAKTSGQRDVAGVGG